MINKISDLQKRKEHFQWVADSLEGKENELYVEKDWYDNPTLISKEDAKKEVEHTQKEIGLLQKERSTHEPTTSKMGRSCRGTFG